MLHRPIAVLALLAALAAAIPAHAATPEASLEMGVRAFRAGDYASALVDLEDATRALTTVERLDAFAETGRFEGLTTLQTALVYLALTQFRMGDEDGARATVHRLAAAEQINPTFARLRLGAEGAEFEALALALAPGVSLPLNTSGAVEDPNLPLPAVTAAAGPTQLSAAERTRIVAALAPPLPGIAPLAPRSTLARQEPAAATPPPRASAPPVDTAVRTAAPATTVPAVPTRDALLLLRKAEALIDHGLVAEANAIYVALARQEGVAREVLIEAATGLYRTGAYRDAAAAFRRFGSFARGEEDLRFYFSVALFESGDYAGAQRELQCALPFIRETDEVLRYQLKISRMQQAAVPVAMLK